MSTETETTYVVTFTDVREMSVEIDAPNPEDAVSIVRWLWRNKHLNRMHDQFTTVHRDDFRDFTVEAAP